MRTEFTNISGEDRHFGYVPPHGVDIPAGGVHTIEGEIKTVLASGRGRFSRTREIAALNSDIQAGNISVAEVAGASSSESVASASPSSPSPSPSSSPSASSSSSSP
jgi:hypothetical protein